MDKGDESRPFRHGVRGLSSVSRRGAAVAGDDHSLACNVIAHTNRVFVYDGYLNILYEGGEAL